MLLRFVAENIFCFAEEVVFTMVASKDDAHPEHIIKTEKHRILRTSALYGANAHGKSRLLDAMALAKHLIINGRKPGQSIPVQPFRLDPDWKTKPSRFEFAILTQGIEYTYGFVVDTTRIHEEWLFSRPNNQEVCLFERVTDPSMKTEIKIGASLAKKGSKDRELIDFLKLSVRANQLFLTECVERNFKKLEPVYNWFATSLHIILPNTPILPINHLVHTDKNFRTFVNNYLASADTGISGVDIHADTCEIESVFPGAPIDLQNHFKESFEKGKMLNISDRRGELTLYSGENGLVRLRLVTQHRTSDGTIIPFDLADESSGTQRLLQMLPILSNSQSDEDENVFILDELDRTLHPVLSRMFVETFLKNHGRKNQLIFTTHETSLLDLNLLRRDEIWFIEKDQQGKAHLESLNTFKIRPDLKIERGYLQGRFGAIPFIGDTSALGW